VKEYNRMNVTSYDYSSGHEASRDRSFWNEDHVLSQVLGHMTGSRLLWQLQTWRRLGRRYRRLTLSDHIN
jgi:hypothetical protein